MKNKLNYLITCTSHIASKDRLRCPSCSEETTKLVSRKYVVTALRQCSKCALLFRTPTTNSAENAAFYQESYSQGFTSDVPSESKLKELIEKKFVGSEKDYSPYIKALEALGVKPGARILDFGCSWGYGSWQMREHGYNTASFEISTPRCRYAREKLGLAAYDKLDDMPSGLYDVFFSAHVLEHVPSVSSVFDYARQKLKKGGLFLAFTPNGSNAFRRVQPKAWQKFWGMVHPNFLDDVFYRTAFPDALLASDPYNYAEISKSWGSGSTKHTLQLEGGELMVAFKME
jgi:2-polyprenyl-3-methyl-5-hydroxy-6-metoxy-1,4-benzoquinol methylase